jgi:hypothetical protein
VIGKISVTTSDGTATSATDLLVIYPPKPTTVTPAAAVVGTQVTIAGTNLTGATLVLFPGLIPATPTAVTATSLKVVVPDGATTGPLNVTNPAGNGNTTTVFKLLPKITGFAPSSGTADSGTVISVSGTNLKVGAGNPIVKIGAFVVPPGKVVGSSLTQVQFQIPLGAVTGKISVTTVDGTATSATDLTVVQPPRVTSFVPAAAVVGTTITINGTNLTGTTSVTFSGIQSATPTMVTPTSLKVAVPAGAVTGPVILFNPIANVTSATSFRLLPKITGFSPASGAVGAQVTVSGTNLQVGATMPVVKVGTVAATVMTSTAADVTFTIPAGAVTGKISVTTVDGTAMSATLLTVAP